MLTQCPACETLFRVTAAILKMGHGQVRCGKCRTQFDALDNLFDEEESPPIVAESQPAVSQREPPPAEETPTEQSAAPSENDAPTFERREPTIDSSETTPHDVADEQTDIAVHADDSEPTIEFDFSTPAVESTPEESIGAAAIAPQPEPPAPTEPAKPGFWKRLSNKRAQLTNSSEIAAELAALTWAARAAAPAPRTRLWAAISLALILALAGQAMHFYRDQLVRDPRFGPTVTRLYHALGLTLAPRWELQAYELQQWGLLTDPAAPNTLRMRATVANRAPFPQPYPLIKLVLKNHADAPVALRAFTPAEYLPERAAADRLLAPEQRANAEIAIVDPGNDAVNFKVSACVRREQVLVCDDD